MISTKEIIWKNIQALMIAKYGKENLNKMVTESKALGLTVSLGSLARIKAQETAIGIDVLENIAKFFNVELWQLLVSDLNPDSLPNIFLDEVSLAQTKLDKIKRVLAGDC